MGIKKIWISRIFGLTTVGIFGALLFSACKNVSEEEIKNFPMAELKGKLVYALNDRIVVHDFATKIDRTVVKKEEGYSPRWSPDGKKLLYKTKSGDLCVVNSDGSNDRVVAHGDLDQSLTQWLDNDNVFIGGLLYMGGTILNITSLKSRASMPEEAKGGSGGSGYELYADKDAVNFLKRNKDSSPIACTQRADKWFVKQAYPFFMPQETTGGMRFSLLEFSQKNYNCSLNKLFENIYVVDTKKEGVLFNSPKACDIYGSYPVWSPDGKYVAVAGGLHFGRYEGQVVYLFANGSESPVVMRELRDKGKKFPYGDREGYTNPRWSPDGRFIACNHYTASGANVFVYDTVSKIGIDIFKGTRVADPDWYK